MFEAHSMADMSSYCDFSSFNRMEKSQNSRCIKTGSFEQQDDDALWNHTIFHHNWTTIQNLLLTQRSFLLARCFTTKQRPQQKLVNTRLIAGTFNYKEADPSSQRKGSRQPYFNMLQHNFLILSFHAQISFSATTKTSTIKCNVGLIRCQGEVRELHGRRPALRCWDDRNHRASCEAVDLQFWGWSNKVSFLPSALWCMYMFSPGIPLGYTSFLSMFGENPKLKPRPSTSKHVL